MPLTARERQQKRREKLKLEGKYDDYKRKHKNYMDNHRRKKSEFINSLPENKKNSIKEEMKIKERVRKRKQREAKKLNPGEGNVVFSSRSSFARALNRVKSKLPKCAKRKNVIIEQLVKEYEPPAKQIKTDPNAFYNEIVTQYYLRDDISRIMPGRKTLK